jgi:hypothetical protein
MTQDKFRVIDHTHDNERIAETKSEAEDMKATAEEFGADDVEIILPGSDTETDGGTAEVVEVDEVATDPTPADPAAAADLPDRSVADDPLTWMPGDFVDEIDGTPAVNRKGFEVLSHFYDISVSADLQVAPDETGHEYARVKATAETDDGRACEAFGSAHVDRGDDETLLLELADTRARKRALSIATGVGAVAVAELKSEVDA